MQNSRLGSSSSAAAGLCAVPLSERLLRLSLACTNNRGGEEHQAVPPLLWPPPEAVFHRWVPVWNQLPPFIPAPLGKQVPGEAAGAGIKGGVRQQYHLGGAKGFLLGHWVLSEESPLRPSQEKAPQNKAPNKQSDFLSYHRAQSN